MLNNSFFSKAISKITFQTTLMAMCISLAPTSSIQGASSVAQTAIDFTGVAKKAIPSVVSIKVRAEKPKTVNTWGLKNSPDDNSRDMFNDDFLKRFFGLPKEDLDDEPTVGQASGFIVSADGYILTNSHVVKDASEIIVTLNDEREFKGLVVGQDPNTDIAIVKIDAKDLPFLSFANPNNLQVGQWAIAIGNPLGLQASLTVGVVSATGRNNLDLARIEDFIQTDAAINRGNSGGPLLNFEGEVIGMNTAIVTMMTGGYMGIGFAIPSNMLQHVMQEVIATGSVSRGFMGVVLQQMDANLAKAFNLEKSQGALVADVSKGSPAEKAGLKQGDIILKYNNLPVTNIAGLRNAVALMKPGSNVNLSVIRDGKTIEIPINIGSFPIDGKPAVEAVADQNKYGFSVQDLTPETAKVLGYSEAKGVVISKVEPGSPAAWAGLKKGSLILAVNQQQVTTAAEFTKALNSTANGTPLLLLVRQGEAVRFVSLQVN